MSTRRQSAGVASVAIACLLSSSGAFGQAKIKRAIDLPGMEASVDKDAIVVDRVVAVVDRSIVLQSEVETAVDGLMRAQPAPPGTDISARRALARKTVLEGLIAEKLIEREMKKLRIDVTAAEIDRVVEGQMRSNGLDETRLKQALAAQGMTLEDYREGLRKQLMKAKIIQLKVKNRVTVSDQDVKATFAKSQNLAAKNFRIRARHILFLVKDDKQTAAQRKKAEAALRRARAGEDFGKLAQSLSEGPSAKSGGKLGTFGKGEMVPAFEEAAYAADVGVPTGPVRSPFGWHVILVDERVIDSATLDAKKEQIRQALYEQEVEQAFRNYVEELKAQAFIEIRGS